MILCRPSISYMQRLMTSAHFIAALKASPSSTRPGGVPRSNRMSQPLQRSKPDPANSHELLQRSKHKADDFR
jgi:hypothetical protein